ncbi:type II secretion system F family protein [Orrella sp. JC864]|uniref:type II secretion system F family protein n=1 Tax=Orrella sp. JC864 TaxID=3120298 RepID=UPI0012BC8BD2
MLLAMAGAAVAAALLAWLAQAWARLAWHRYQQAFTAEARLRLSEFFVFVDPLQLWLLTVLLCGVGALLAYVLSGSIAVAGLCGAAGLYMPRWLAARAKAIRLARFDEQLPEALLSMAWSLRAGASLPVALRAAVADGAVPLSQELGLLLREQRMGIGLEQCLENLHARMATEACGLMCAALRIAVRTGGNLSDALERIAVNLRARLLIHRRIHALTAQGRMQAWVVGALPVLLLAVLDKLEPEAMAPLWRTPAGWTVLGLILLLEAAGIAMIRRLTRIEV